MPSETIEVLAARYGPRYRWLATVTVMLVWRLAPLKVMAGGAVIGLLRNRLCDRAALCVTVWGR